MRLFAKSLLLGVLLVVAAIAPVSAQVATETAGVGEITLEPLTDEAFGFSTLVPAGWTNLGNGIYARQNSAADTTLIAQQSAPLGPDMLLNAILPQLGLTEAPESVGTYQGGALDWTLYQVDVPAGAITVAVDLALAQDGGTTYAVLLQTSPEEYDTLHTDVFLPILDTLAPLELTGTPVPYVVENVTFDNGDVTLAGTLTLPPTEGPHPAVVLITGSGPQDRDETLGGIALRPFRLIADALTREGIAVLRYDDRGVGESSGDFLTATMMDFASDAAAGIDYLLTRDEINPDQIGVLGHSEGGTVAAMLGANNPDLDFIISMAGTAVNGRDILRVQNQRIYEAEGATQVEIDAQLAFIEEVFTVLDDPEAVEALTYERTLEQLQALPEEERAALGDLEQYARAIAEQTAQEYSAGWFPAFLDYDPGPDWAQTTVPVLALFGGKDVQVDAEQNAPVLEAALAEAGNEVYEIVVLPNANHLFQEADTGSVAEYSTLPAEFTPEFLPTIIEWLRAHVDIGS